MAGYTEERYDVNGIDTAVFTAGDGPSLVYFHGAGTLTGFDKLLPLSERFRLIVPNHPGYGASADDPSIDSIQDYINHYLDLFDQLGVDELTLVGLSMGGYMAATFAIQQTHRVQQLVLCCPIGMRVPEHPITDIFTIPDEQLLGYLAVDLSCFDDCVPMPPTPEFLAERYREQTSTARVFWNRVYDPKLPKWLHRVTMPTLLLWGDQDRLVPVQQAAVWAEHIPNATIKTLPNVGHLLFEETPDATGAILEFAGQGVAV
jgi:pimeloyl-ACP methyl ester carboxylesterase